MDIKSFQITADKNIPLDINASSLDGMTGQLSQGFYTTFSTLSHGTRVLGLKSHLQRLYGPAEELRLHPPVNETELCRRIAILVKENLPHESRVRLILTKDRDQLYIGVQSFEPLPETVYTKGVKVISTETARQDPRIKDTGFISSSAEQRKLLSKDVFEILLTKDGKILEGMTSNFYIIKHVVARNGGTKQPVTGRLLRRENHPSRNDIRLITAQHGILLGVTRKAVLGVARGQGMSIQYRFPKLNERFDEAFLTSSSRGVVPIVSIDNKSVGQGGVGKWSKILSEAYQAYVEERSESIVATPKSSRPTYQS